MAIQSSNAQCFDDRTILSVWHFVGAHLADLPRRDVATLFGRVDLASIHRRAQLLTAGKHGRMGNTTDKITTLLADKLLEHDAA
ncbi:MAG: hypothetical protein EOO82_02410 [Oxalobacteraceae bacterium]|nr:MAG: hypothetical protein EOO82_02410 [Oxalobacteraceae bacterium]